MEYTTDNPLRVITLCSGYDSQCLALERLKREFPTFYYELVAWAEFDPESKQPIERQPAVLAHNALFPQWADRNLGDITKVDWESVPKCDLLFYSTPCQSISQAGLQHGFAEGSGTRSSIIWNVLDAVKVLRPKYICMENVAAIVSAKFVYMFNLWQNALAALGYVQFPTMLNALDYGVPQDRKRMFLVSIRDDGAEVYPTFNAPKRMTLKRKMRDVLEKKVDERYYLSDRAIASFAKRTKIASEKGNGFKFAPTTGGGTRKPQRRWRGAARTITTFTMNKKIEKPLLEFLAKTGDGIYMVDFQFKRINYQSSEVACTINASYNRSNTTYIIEIE